MRSWLKVMTVFILVEPSRDEQKLAGAAGPSLIRSSAIVLEREAGPGRT